MKNKLPPTTPDSTEPALPEGHGLVLLPDGRVAKVKRTYDVGRRKYYIIKVAGKHVRLHDELVISLLKREASRKAPK
jgi:hypothetical protein